MVLGLEYPNHFYEWGEISEKEKRLLVLASRDHGKTTFFEIILPIDRILRNTAYKILVVSYSDTQVLKIGSAIKSTFESRPLLKAFSPKSDEDWSKSRMLFKDGSLIETLAFGSTGRGGHYDLVLIDDPVKDFGGMNPDEQSQYLTRTITPMVKPDGQMIVTGNYVYDNDLIDRIEKNKAFTTKKYPAISKDGIPLWPEYWPITKLSDRRRELESSDDPFAFQKEYLLEKIDSKAQFFKRSMFRHYDPGKIPERLSVVASLDPAITTSGDFTAIMVTGTSEEKKSYLLDYRNIRTDDVDNIIEELFILVKTHSVPYVQVETIGFQKLLKVWIYEAMRKRDHHFGIEEIKTHKKSKEARIMSLQPRIAAGSLLFHPTLHEDVIRQFLAFPRGSHDDMIDALSFQVGKWDNPEPPEKFVPKNSFNWWKDQHQPQASDWQSSMNL